MAPSQKRQQRANNIVYDVFLWIFTVVADLFFREIHPRSTWRIPKKGAVIFVAAPHANQFVDPLILARVVRQDAHRRIAFLIAEKSMKRAFIGMAAGLMGSVPVGRALDMKKPAEGRIYLPDPDGDATLIKGTNTDFTSEQFMVGGLLVLPSHKNTAANAEIEEIVSKDKIRLKKPFKGNVALKQLTGKPLKEETGQLANGNAKKGENFDGVSFSVAPHVDQSDVYNAVFERIKAGGCIGIFPEGGSHDRTELLPLKAGLAIMALGALAEDPTCGVQIVPVGMNYFHAHKFRSRAVVEFGTPISIDPALVEMYKHGRRRDAVGKVLQMTFEGLAAVTVQAQDYDTLMLIQAVRRLYNPQGKKLPLPFIIELNRRLIKGYETFKNDPRIVSLRKSVLDYNRTLFRLNIRDHQVSYARFSWVKVMFLILYRVSKLLVLSLAVIPGAVLFSPVFILGKLISKQKAKEALAASSVKIHARDVMATWKILVSLALAPALDVCYTITLTIWTYSNRVNGCIPEWIPLWLVTISSLIAFPMLCFGALRFGEIGMDIFKSLKPLLLSANPTHRNTFIQLRHQRQWLQEKVDEIINELGPDLFPDFDKQRIIDDPLHPLHSPDRSRPGTPTHRRSGSEFDFNFTQVHPRPPSLRVISDTGSVSSSIIPRNESFKYIGNVGIFASNPATPSRSRSRNRSRANSDAGASGNNALLGLTSMDDHTPKKADMDEVSRNLHQAMRERGRKRKSNEGWEIVAESDEDEDEEEGKKSV